MQKRGLNAIITTVLIILMAIIAIGLIWTFVRPFVGESSEEIGTIAGNCFSLVLEPKSCRYNNSAELVSVRVERRTGTSPINGLNFIFSDNSKRTAVKLEGISLNELESKSFPFSYDLLGDIDLPPSLFTIAGIIDPKVSSCDEVRPPIACLEAVCGDGIVDAFIGEECDGGCCDSRCHTPATCDRIDNDGDNETDEADEFLLGGFKVEIGSPVEDANYQTLSLPYNSLNLSFITYNNSLPTQRFDIERCWYRINNGPVIAIPSCNNEQGGGANGGTNFTLFTAPLSFDTSGSKEIDVFVEDELGYVSRGDVIFVVQQAQIQLTSPAEGELVVNSSIVLSFAHSVPLQSCSYSLNAGPVISLLQCTSGTNVITAPEGIHLLTFYAQTSAGGITDSNLFGTDSCPGDFTANSRVEFADLGWVLSTTLGCGTPEGPSAATCNRYLRNGIYSGDLNIDGQVTALDYNHLLAPPVQGGFWLVNYTQQYGIICPFPQITQYTAEPASLPVGGGTVQLTWNSNSNVVSCAATSTPLVAWDGARSTSGNEGVGITQRTNLTLNCYNFEDIPDTEIIEILVG